MFYEDEIALTNRLAFIPPDAMQFVNRKVRITLRAVYGFLRLQTVSMEIHGTVARAHTSCKSAAELPLR